MRSLFVALVLAILGGSGTHQTPSFDHSLLSERGRQAHQKLAETVIFSVGGVGFAGQQSEAELALHTLLHEDHAVPALTDLFFRATKEGKMYALFGLRIKDREAFYRLRKQENASERTEWTINLMSGCLLMPEEGRAVLAKIEAGYYDASFRPTPIR